MEWLAAVHIKDHGQPCAVTNASGSVVNSFVILKNVGTRTDLKYIENFREGLALADSGMVSGSWLTVGGSQYIVTTSQIDQATRQIVFQAVKVNASLEVQRRQNTYDAYGNATAQDWAPVAQNIPAYADPNFSRMHQEDSGLVPAQAFRVIFRAGYDVRVLDRVVFLGMKYQVDFIDQLFSPGNVALMVSNDTRA